MKFIYISTLKKVSYVISCALLMASCTLPITRDDIQQLVSPEAQAIDITHEYAATTVDENDWNFFTDYSSPYSCDPSFEKPNEMEAPWVEPSTIWQRMRLGFQLEETKLNNSRIHSQFSWYQKHPEYIRRVSERSSRYIHHVTEQLEERSMPLELALLPIVESAYDPFAYSHGRASGMWQFIPGTGKMFGLEQNWWYDGRRDIVASTDAALRYLQKLNDYYGGDWLLALAAYNSGQGNVNKAIRKNKKRGKPTDYWSLDLPRETQHYVPKLLALAKMFENPRRYGIKLEPVYNQPYFAQVETLSQIDLAQAARLADTDINEIYRLNPGFNRWATSPTGPHRLLIPIEKQIHFEKQLAQLPTTDRLNWQRYTIKPGDSLLLLAKRFKTDAKTIKNVNKLSGNMIRAGQSLMIPTASQEGKHYSLSADQRLATIHKNRKGSSNSQQTFHSVKQGESLWTISRRYRVSVSKLAHWNGIAPKDTLKLGQKLSIWQSPQHVSKLENQRKGIVKKLGYRVRSGDSLARIADRFNVRIKDIVKWNEVNPKKYLKPGQKLTLYVDVINNYR